MKGGGTGSKKKHLEAKHPLKFKEFMVKVKEDIEKRSAQKAKSADEKSKLKQELKKQTSLESCLLPKKQNLLSSDPKSVRLDLKIARMLAICDLPFEFVETVGFKDLMAEIPEYELKTQKFYKTLFEYHDRLHEKIEEKILESGSHISFTTDIWSNQVEALFSLTAHLITSSFEREKFVLHAQPLGSERHTGANLSDVFDQMLTFWKIDKKIVHVVVRDSGSNIVKALNDSKLKNISCAAHQMNLVVTRALESQQLVKNITSTCRQIAGYFHRSDSARKKLGEIQIRLWLNQTPLRLTQEVPTRWNSTLAMLSRIVELKLAAGEDITDWNIQTSILEKVISALSPFQNATDKVLIPTVRWLNNMLSNNVDAKGIGSFVESLQSNMDVKFGNLETIDEFAIATFIDPRYKENFLVKAGTMSNIVETLKLLISNANEQNDLIIQTPSKKPRVEKKREVGSFNDFIASSGDDEDDSSNVSGDMDYIDKVNYKKLAFKKNIHQNYLQEINLYLKNMKRILPEEDPLSWWHQNVNSLPNLSVIAKKILSAPATSVPSEQLFSGAGQIYDPTRNRLKGDTVEKLLFVKYNLATVGLKFL